jgi:hypothetical protein
MVVLLVVQIVTINTLRNRPNEAVEPVVVTTTSVVVATTTTTLAPVVRVAIPTPEAPGTAIAPSVKAHGIQIDVTAVQTLRISDVHLGFELAARFTNISDQVMQIPRASIACGTGNAATTSERIINRTDLGEAKAGFDVPRLQPGASTLLWLDPVVLQVPLSSACEGASWLALRMYPTPTTERGEGFFDTQKHPAVLLPVDLRQLIDGAPSFPAEVSSSMALCDVFSPSALLRRVNAQVADRTIGCRLINGTNVRMSASVTVEPRMVAAMRAEAAALPPVPVIEGEGFGDEFRLLVFKRGTVTVLELSPTAVTAPGTILTDFARLAGLTP